MFQELEMDDVKFGVLKGSLNKLGYSISRMYFGDEMVRTDATLEVLYSLLVKHKRECQKEKWEGEGYVKNIFERALELEVNFKEDLSETYEKINKVAFKTWGPKRKK